MDLWIRSQSRSMLIKATDVHLDYDTMIKCDKHIVADYSTTERALEIINEIEATLKIFSKSREIFVYEMPKE